MANLSIYSHILRPHESAPSFTDTMKNGMNLRQMAMQNQRGQQQMVDEDRKRRRTGVAEAMESLASMSPEQRAAAFPQVQENLIKSGYMSPDQALPEHDEGLFQSSWAMIQRQPEYLERQKTISETEKNFADARRKDSNAEAYARQVDAMERMRLAREKQLDSGVAKLQDNLGNSQDAVRSIKDVENTLGFQLEDYDPKKDDLPGVSIPGYGRVTAFSSEARDLNSSMAKIFNTVLKDRSGSAVTTPELDRLRDEFNTGKYNDEHELIKAAQRYKAGMMAKMRDIEAGSNPNAVAEYRERRGTTSQDLAYREGQRKQAGGNKTGSGTTSAFASTPRKNTFDMSEEELLRELQEK